MILLVLWRFYLLNFAFNRYFMVLNVGVIRSLPQAMTSDEATDETVTMVEQRRRALNKLRDVRKSGKCPKKSAAWIKHKKDLARRRGKDVAHDSKFTGRSRGPRF